jgi:hypothetical protein
MLLRLAITLTVGLFCLTIVPLADAATTSLTSSGTGSLSSDLWSADGVWLRAAEGQGAVSEAAVAVNSCTGGALDSSFPSTTVSGSIATAGEIDCYTLGARSGDILSFHLSGSSAQLAVLDAHGSIQCSQTGTQCTIGGTGPFTLLVYSGSGTTTGSYRFDATCENLPCGQTDTTITDAVPARIGQGESTTVLLRGHDLDLLKTATLRQGDRIVTGEPQTAAPDGRAIDVRFNLADAPTGRWALQATFIDGSTRTLSDAVTVESARAPAISVQMVGRDVFRAGQPNSVTVVVTNSGNIDAIGVPVALNGIPAGATIEAAFDLHVPTGDPSSIEIHKTTFDQSNDTLTTVDGIFAPFLIARVPAGRAVQFEYRIMVPTPSSYSIRASAGQCLGASTLTTSRVQARAATTSQPRSNCLGTVTGAVIGLAADSANWSQCTSFAAGMAWDAADAVGNGENIWSLGRVFGWLGHNASDGIGCALHVSETTLVGRALYVFSKWQTAADLVRDCLLMPAQSLLNQRAVTSIDPNDIRGSAGTGSHRYIAGNEPLPYQIFFENLASATAPAQRVEVTDQLDTAVFDPSSVLFQNVRVGSTVYSLPYGGPALDQVLDLRPAQNLLVHVMASVSDSGQVHWELQAIDPETLAPPDDPTVGFLPPNHNSPEGEGQVSFQVSLKSLPSGASVPNKASIRFDSNAPIETPTWTNTIDKQAPSAIVSAQGTADSAAAQVSWSGSDDASGISLFEIRVSKDGGPFSLWRTSDTGGEDTFVVKDSGAYSFRVIAHDGAGNVGQSAQSAVTLSTDTTAPPSDHGGVPMGGGGGPTGGGGGGGTQAPTLSRPGAARKVTVASNGSFAIPIMVGCPGAGPNCVVSTLVTASVRTGKKKVTIGRSSFSVTAGTTMKARGKLTTGNWRPLLKRSHTIKVKVRITVTRGSLTANRTMALTFKASSRGR